MSRENYIGSSSHQKDISIVDGALADQVHSVVDPNKRSVIVDRWEQEDLVLAASRLSKDASRWQTAVNALTIILPKLDQIVFDDPMINDNIDVLTNVLKDAVDTDQPGQ